MTAGCLLAHLSLQGIRLDARAQRLRYCPRSAVTPMLAALLRENEGEIRTLLQAETLNDQTRREVRRAMIDVANHLYSRGSLDWQALDAIDERLESASTLPEALNAARDYIDSTRQCAH